MSGLRLPESSSELLALLAGAIAAGGFLLLGLVG